MYACNSEISSSKFSPSDYERSVHFYQEWLGLELIRAWDRGTDKGALFSAGGGAVVELVNPPRSNGPGAVCRRLGHGNREAREARKFVVG
jgi:catechol 2,3-dioxygenase-like lactoylglutathione lyase family enzyme